MASYPGFALLSAKHSDSSPHGWKCLWNSRMIGASGLLRFKQINEVETYHLALYLTHVEQITFLQ